MDCYSILVPDSIDIEKYVMMLEETGDFEFVEYNCVYSPCMSANDYHFNNQWHLSAINASDAWDITTGNPSIKVAVIDDGVLLTHEDLYYGNDSYSNLSITDNVDYVSSTDHTPNTSHGTGVAGVIGAKTNNNYVGVAGVAGGYGCSGATIISYRTNYTSSHIISAIYDAVNKGVKVINLSIVGGYNSNLSNALDYAYNNGVTVVCASGNDSSSVSFPASHQYTIAVGNINQSYQRANDSNYGSGLDLVAPGTGIWTTCKNTDGKYWAILGTSFAAPQVAGVVALMLSINPTLTPSQIRNTLQSTCTKISGYSYNNGWNNEVGYGLLNAFAALITTMNLSISGPTYICSSSTGTYTINNLPSSCTVNWYLSDGFGPTAPTLQISGNNCIINNNLSKSYMGILHADIYYQGTLLKTLMESVVLYAGFYGTYSINGGATQQINTSYSVIWVNHGDLVEIKSPNLVTKNVSYSVVTPYLWHYYTFSGDLDVGYPSSAGNNPIVISVQNNTNYSNCDNSHQITLMPTSVLPHYLLKTTGDNGCINVELIADRNEDALETLRNLPVSIQIDENPTWTLEVIDANWGEKVLTKEITGNSTSVSLSKSKGVFIVRATIGKEVLTEKIQVK